MLDTMSVERRKSLIAYGAKPGVTEGPRVCPAAIAKTEEMKAFAPDR